VDATKTTDCNPLADYRAIADRLKQLKQSPDDIVVTAIFGWPTDDTEMATAQLVVDEVPNPNATSPGDTQIFDTLPICHDPSYLPGDPQAAAMGGTAGLRLSAFIDPFGANGLKFGICQPDFSAAMETYGYSGDARSRYLCIDLKLFDADLTQPGVQINCRVSESDPPVGSPQGPYTESPYPQCDDAHSVVPCWQVNYDTTKCPVNGQWLPFFGKPGRTYNEGTFITVQCEACPEISPDTPAIPGCDYTI
jgi:hypothetical protein